MKTILSLVLFLVIGIIFSRGLFTRPRIRLPVTVLFLTGIEFFFLGVLLGPSFFNLITSEVLNDLKPIVYLALGWAGLLFGIQLSWQHLQRVAGGVFKLLVYDGFLVMASCSVLFFVLLRVFFPQSPLSELLASTVLLSITAAINSPTIVTVLSSMMPSRGKFTSVIKVATSLSAVIPLVGVGLLFTVAHPGFFFTEGLWSGVLRWVFANVVGVVMGLVFTLFTAQRISRDERLLVIMGTAIFVGGICYFLRLSALYTSMIMGVVVGNISGRRVQIFEQLISFEKTLYIAFLILVGAMVSFEGTGLIVIVLAYVAIRMTARVLVSSWTIGRSFPEFKAMGRRSGLALSAQGAVALAIALDYGLGFTGPLVEEIVAVVALSVVINEFVGVVLTQKALRASGDVPAGKPATDAGGTVDA